MVESVVLLLAFGVLFLITGFWIKRRTNSMGTDKE